MRWRRGYKDGWKEWGRNIWLAKKFGSDQPKAGLELKFPTLWREIDKIIFCMWTNRIIPYEGIGHLVGRARLMKLQKFKFNVPGLTPPILPFHRRKAHSLLLDAWDSTATAAEEITLSDSYRYVNYTYHQNHIAWTDFSKQDAIHAGGAMSR